MNKIFRVSYLLFGFLFTGPILIYCKSRHHNENIVDSDIYKESRQNNIDPDSLKDQSFKSRLELLLEGDGKVILLEEGSIESVNISTNSTSKLNLNQSDNSSILVIPLSPEQVKKLDLDLLDRISFMDGRYFIDLPVSIDSLGITDDELPNSSELELTGLGKAAKAAGFKTTRDFEISNFYGFKTAKELSDNQKLSREIRTFSEENKTIQLGNGFTLKPPSTGRRSTGIKGFSIFRGSEEIGQARLLSTKGAGLNKRKYEFEVTIGDGQKKMNLTLLRKKNKGFRLLELDSSVLRKARFQKRMNQVSSGIPNRINNAEIIQPMVNHFKHNKLPALDVGKIYKYRDFEMRVNRVLGQGVEGVVYELKLVSNTGTETTLAAKVMRGKSNEFDIASQFSDSPQFVKAYGSSSTPDGKQVIFYEQISHDLTSNSVSYSLNTKKQQISDIVDGLSQIHERGLVHNDFNPKNIFIDTNGEARIGDIGGASKPNELVIDPELIPGLEAEYGKNWRKQMIKRDPSLKPENRIVSDLKGLGEVLEVYQSDFPALTRLIEKLKRGKFKTLSEAQSEMRSLGFNQ